VLTITGSQGRYQPEGFDQVLEEYGTGVYRRSFTMSREIDEAGITARIRNGVLEVELPKAADARPRRIAVEVAD
jgi:HSP20 family molecular chaperone IbpA